jgi:hypothetical protein
MRRQPTMPTPFPLALWWQLGLKTWEMLMASGQVIGHRVTRMATAGTKPSARDRREFNRMGSEKLQAAAQSGWAMAAQMQTAWWRSCMQLMLAGLGPVHRTATANARRLGRIPARRRRRR